jgi:CBS domain-containing protein
MITVKEIIKKKGSEVYSISPDATVEQALRLMAEKEVGALMVMDGEKMKGIFSERDYARRGFLIGCSELGKVSQLMTKTLVYIGLDDTLEDCMNKMTDKHIRHLPVVKDGKLAGMISIGDIVKAIITEQKNLIQNLEDYMQGSGYAH